MKRYWAKLVGTYILVFAGCGASMNPARSIAPALVSGKLSELWIYIVAPVLGAVLAGIFFVKVIQE